MVSALPLARWHNIRIAVRKIIRFLTALIAAQQVALGAGPPITQEEAEKFVSSFYHDLEEDDLDRVMIHFDESVEYYSFGKKPRDYIEADIAQYFNLYPSRSLSVSAVKLKAATAPDRVTVNFDLHSFLRNPDRDVTHSGHSHMEWDLVKRDGAVKIVRYAGTSATGPTATP